MLNALVISENRILRAACFVHPSSYGASPALALALVIPLRRYGDILSIEPAKL